MATAQAGVSSSAAVSLVVSSTGASMAALGAAAAGAAGSAAGGAVWVRAFLGLYSGLETKAVFAMSAWTAVVDGGSPTMLVGIALSIMPSGIVSFREV